MRGLKLYKQLTRIGNELRGHVEHEIIRVENLIDIAFQYGVESGIRRAVDYLESDETDPDISPKEVARLFREYYSHLLREED